jgi:hypothetical protein
MVSTLQFAADFLRLVHFVPGAKCISQSLRDFERGGQSWLIVFGDSIGHRPDAFDL